MFLLIICGLVAAAEITAQVLAKQKRDSGEAIPQEATCTSNGCTSPAEAGHPYWNKSTTGNLLLATMALILLCSPVWVLPVTIIVAHWVGGFVAKLF